jgi:hypothetical protein
LEAELDPDEAKAMGRMLQGAKPMRLSPLDPANVVDESTRGAVLPFARYSDGGVHPAWPGMISGPAKAFKSLLSDPYLPHRGDTPDNASAKLDHVNEVAGAVGFFGAAVPRPRGSIGTGGRPASELPMDHASRMARAEEMGFDTSQPLYHGTRPDANITAFDNSMLGESTGTASSKTGTFLTSSRSQADTYGRFANGAGSGNNSWGMSGPKGHVMELYGPKKVKDYDLLIEAQKIAKEIG